MIDASKPPRGRKKAAARPEKKKPTPPPGPAPSKNGHSFGNGYHTDTPPGRDVTCLGDLTVQQRSWLWEGIVPYGVATVLTGPQSVGKTAFLSAAATEVTYSGVLSGTNRKRDEHVLWYSCEDDPRSVLLPRLQGAGVRVDRVHVPDYDGQGRKVRHSTIPANAQAIGDLAFRLNARLVVIDPLTSYMSDGMSANDPLQVRAVMDSLNMMAALHDLAVIVVLHPRKNISGSALDWVSGSTQWTQAARMVVMMTAHPDKKGEYLMSAVKPCSAHGKVTLEYSLDSSGGSPVFIPGNPSAIDPREIGELGDLGQIAERTDALEWMRQELVERKETTALFRRWQAQGYGRNLWWSCRRKLDVQYEREGTQTEQVTYLYLKENRTVAP